MEAQGALGTKSSSPPPLGAGELFFEDPLDAAAMPIATPASTTSPPTMMAPVGIEPRTGSSATPPASTAAVVWASAGVEASPSDETSPSATGASATHAPET